MRAVTRVLIGGAFLGTFTCAAFAATVRDNQVVFDVNGMQSFSFQETGHSISSGQPYGGTTAGVINGQGVIDVQAGRNNTSGPATWFKQQVGAGQTIVCDTSGTYPSDLNFAVEGTLTIGSVNGKTITCDNVTIAQGNYAGTNNWWMGGPGMKGIHVSQGGAVEQTCKRSSGPAAVVTFAPETPCVNHFNISVSQP
jgi:hypothetical protein